MRRTVPILAALLCLLAPLACAKSGGSKEKFCAALPKTGDVMSILSDFTTSDPGALAKRFETGLAEYRDLERAAPREIRGDVAKVADAVQVVLDIVEQHPDDLSAIRTQLAAKAATLASAGKSALTIGDYAQDECGEALPGADLGGTGSLPTVPAATTTTAP